MCFSVLHMKPMNVPEQFLHMPSLSMPVRKAFGSEQHTSRKVMGQGKISESFCLMKC